MSEMPWFKRSPKFIERVSNTKKGRQRIQMLRDFLNSSWKTRGRITMNRKYIDLYYK